MRRIIMPRKKTIKPMTTVSTAPKTTAEKLAAAEALVAKYQQQLISETLKNDVQNGDVVSFIFGRGDKKKSLTGSVMATQDIADGTLKGLNLRVLVGEGFDAETFKVHIRDVTSNVTADARRAAEGGAVDPLNVA
jgi:hypothetical protein